METKITRLGRGGTPYVRIPDDVDPQVAADMINQLRRRGNKYKRDYLKEFNDSLGLKQKYVFELEARIAARDHRDKQVKKLVDLVVACEPEAWELDDEATMCRCRMCSTKWDKELREHNHHEDCMFAIAAKLKEKQ